MDKNTQKQINHLYKQVRILNKQLKAVAQKPSSALPEGLKKELSSLPEGFVAMEASGYWFWFEEKPILVEEAGTFLRSSEKGNFEGIGFFEGSNKIKDWRQSWFYHKGRRK